VQSRSVAGRHGRRSTGAPAKAATKSKKAGFPISVEGRAREGEMKGRLTVTVTGPAVALPPDALTANEMNRSRDDGSGDDVRRPVGRHRDPARPIPRRVRWTRSRSAVHLPPVDRGRAVNVAVGPVDGDHDEGQPRARGFFW